MTATIDISQVKSELIELSLGLARLSGKISELLQKKGKTSAGLELSQLQTELFQIQAAEMERVAKLISKLNGLDKKDALLEEQVHTPEIQRESKLSEIEEKVSALEARFAKAPDGTQVETKAIEPSVEAPKDESANAGEPKMNEAPLEVKPAEPSETPDKIDPKQAMQNRRRARAARRRARELAAKESKNEKEAPKKAPEETVASKKPQPKSIPTKRVNVKAISQDKPKAVEALELTNPISKVGGNVSELKQPVAKNKDDVLELLNPVSK